MLLTVIPVEPTVREVRVPREVILACAAVLRVPVRVVAVTVFAPDIELLFIAIFPPILRDVRVPREVILACAAVLRVPVRVVAVTVFASDIELLFITIFPPILRDVRVPREVILACAAVLRVPVRVVAVTVFAPDIELLFITIFPPILRDVRVPTLVNDDAVTPLANVFPDRSAAALTVILALGNVTVRSPVGSVNASVVENKPLLALNGVAILLTVIPVEPTVKEVRVPTEVILACAAVLNVPVRVVAVTVFAPDIELLFITIFPPILREVRVPTLVKEEAVIPLANVFPDKSAAAFTVILALGNVTVRSPVGSVNASVVENEPLLALNGVAMLLTVIPVEPTVKEVRVPTDVILPCAAVLRVPLKVVALIVPVTSR
jgi:hypothetical protein